MTEIWCELDPGLDELYLESLNTAFGSWGDEKLYDWVFGRRCGSFMPDQMILRDGDEILAGSGISYRKLGRGERAFDVGIMTGSWTLPAARGRGCFKRIIQESVEVCREKGCGLLLAFVTHDNPSRYGLESDGSALLDSQYIFSSDTPAESDLPCSPARESAEEIFEVIHGHTDRLRILYPDFEAFEGQILQRAHPVEKVAVGSARVFIEKAADTDRVAFMMSNGEEPEAVYGALANRAAEFDRKFFAFRMTDRPPIHLASKAGFLTALMANPEVVANVLGIEASWAGDSTVLSDPSSDWFLGQFHIDSGDRM